MCCALVLLALCGGVGVCISRAAGGYVGNSVGMFIGVYPWSQEFVRLVCLLFGRPGFYCWFLGWILLGREPWRFLDGSSFVPGRLCVVTQGARPSKVVLRKTAAMVSPVGFPLFHLGGSMSSPCSSSPAIPVRILGGTVPDSMRNRVGFHLPLLLVVSFPFWESRRPASRGRW